MAVLTLCSMSERFYSITNPTGPVFHHQQDRSVSEKWAGLAGGLESGQNGLLGCGHTHLTSSVIYLMRGWICSQIGRMSGWGSLSRLKQKPWYTVQAVISNNCWQGNFSLHLHTMPHVSLRSWGWVSSSNWGRGHMTLVRGIGTTLRQLSSTHKNLLRGNLTSLPPWLVAPRSSQTKALESHLPSHFD